MTRCFECGDIKDTTRCSECTEQICDECQEKHNHNLHFDDGNGPICGSEEPFITDNPKRATCLACRAKFETSDYKATHEVNTNF